MQPYEFATASQIGRRHREASRNNQDALLVRLPRSAVEPTVAVVSDGCGSTPHSELGAFLLVRLFADLIARDNGSIHRLEQRLAEIATQLKLLARQLSGQDELVLASMLATLVAAVIGPDNAHFIVVGDGVVTINGETRMFTDGDGTPPYLGYAALEDQNLYRPIEALPINTITLPRADLTDFVIASDGLGDLIDHQDSLLPGSSQETVGKLDKLWTSDSFFTNPDALRRYLARVNRDVSKFDRASGELTHYRGLLDDDTTVIVGRRLKMEG
ncbi:protein phosphatase 2C domain-containing protein [Candidatus Saccharibacteria bacterium]|nr:protein phosphatase 2C domain-containing protein [Candidatus Saccharibacteria bacterium]MCB9821742.1 protein phosphatase 2C domain-containing protein [Candidatus Nomurabacteria bacterium]